MSSELDDVARSLYNGQLPSIWRALAPATLKSLGNWMSHFLRRNQQYNTWVRYIIITINNNFYRNYYYCQVNNGEPYVMWLSGLHIPESYLTALVQATCRKNGWPLDKSTLYTAVTEVKVGEEDWFGREIVTVGRLVGGMYICMYYCVMY